MNTDSDTVFQALSPLLDTLLLATQQGSIIWYRQQTNVGFGVSDINYFAYFDQVTVRVTGSIPSITGFCNAMDNVSCGILDVRKQVVIAADRGPKVRALFEAIERIDAGATKQEASRYDIDTLDRTRREILNRMSKGNI